MVNSKEISESLVQWVESPENNPEIKIGLYEQKKCELMDHGYIFPSKSKLMIDNNYLNNLFNN